MPAGSSKNYFATREERLFAKLQANSKNLVQSCPRQSREGPSETHFWTPRESVPPPRPHQWTSTEILSLSANLPKKSWESNPLCCCLCAYLGREKSHTFLFLMEWLLGNSVTLPSQTPMNAIRLITQAFRLSRVCSPFLS